MSNILKKMVSKIYFGKLVPNSNIILLELIVFLVGKQMDKA